MNAPVFEHRIVSGLNDRNDFADTITLVTDRAISVLALISEQFESLDS